MTEPTQPQYIHHGDGTWMSRGELYDNFRGLGGLKEYLYDWGGLNKWLFLQINSIRENSYDAMMVFISKLAEYKLFPYYLAAIFSFFILSLLIRKIRKKGAVKQRTFMWFGIFAVLIVGFAVNGVTTKVAKNVFSYPRPYVELAKSDVNLLEAEDGADDGYRSFPSGHVAFITFIIISLWPAFRSDLKWYSLFLIALVGWSRISVGMHYPADVVGAFLITSMVIIITRMIVYFLLRKFLRIVC